MIQQLCTKRKFNQCATCWKVALDANTQQYFQTLYSWTAN